MKKFNITILLLTVIVLVGSISIFMFYRIENQQIQRERIYLIIKTVSENTLFWDNVINGAEVAANELGVEVIVRGPQKETNVEEQIQIIQELIDEKPTAIAVAAVDFDAIADVCDEIVKNDIIVVTFDSDANMISPHSFVATNNLSSSKRLGHELADIINEHGKVAILSHVEGAYTASERIDGFVQGIKPYPDIEVVGETYYTDNSREIAYEAVMEIVEIYPELTALYATNEVSLLGVGEAIKELGLEEQITVVGFDMNYSIALMIEEGVIDVSMVQKPFNMGYTAIKEVLEVKEGKAVEFVDTGSVLINKDNMFLPENQKLIVPYVD